MLIKKIVLEIDREKQMAFTNAILTDNTRVLLTSHWRVTGAKKSWEDKKYDIMNNDKKIGSAYEIDEVKETW